MIYKLQKDSNELIELEETTFSKERIFELTHIEEWVRKNPKILCDADEDILIISKQQASETMKRSDLVGIDNLGNITVIELKRDIAEPMTGFQAIQYASYYSDTKYDQACEIYAKYLRENKDEFKLGVDTDFLEAAQESIRNFCDQIKIPDDFNRNQRIILVAREFKGDLLSAVTWLIYKEIEIKCIELTLYKHGGDLFIAPTTILPTPDISENIVRVKQKDELVKQERQAVTRQKWLGNMEDHYNNLQPPLGEYLARLVSELKIEPSGMSGSGFHLFHGDKKIMITTWQRSKIEIRFSRTKKEDLERLLKDFGITSLVIKEKSDIESYGLANPTPAIDYKEESGNFNDVITFCKVWLGTG